jgi:hypothetical protein
MKKNLFVIGIGFLFIGASIFSACTKEGPMGPAGANGTNGTNGTNGVDGGTTCTECHNPETVTTVLTQYELSKHGYGEAAFEEAGNASCGPCHLSEAFKYVCANNIPSTFTLNTTTNKYVNDYAATSSTAYGEITCNTCHSSLHTTYGKEDLSPLTTIAAVKMTMWGGSKEINLPADGGISNLCVKCHQPRPFTASNGNGNVLDYVGLATNPTAVFYDAAQDNSLNLLKPGYRTHTHYGTIGAIYAGIGGVEFAGAAVYENSVHTTMASCQDCHMAPMNGKSGGHTFFAAGNFKGCNVDGCHTGMSSSSATYTATRTDAKAKLDALAAKLVVNGVEILNRNPNAESNLWASKTTNKYDGYLNVYDPINNPDGIANNAGGGGTFQNPSPSNSWSAAQKALNLTLPLITLTNAQMGAIINFQMCLREYSLGIHNTKYTMALLNNTLAILP